MNNIKYGFSKGQALRPPLEASLHGVGNVAAQSTLSSKGWNWRWIYWRPETGNATLKLAPAVLMMATAFEGEARGTG